MGDVITEWFWPPTWYFFEVLLDEYQLEMVAFPSSQFEDLFLAGHIGTGIIRHLTLSSCLPAGICGWAGSCVISNRHPWLVRSLP